MPDLLIELRSEEIPARMQARAAADLKRLVTDGLVEAGLTYGGAEAFAGPRRLTLAVEGLLAESPTAREERKGPIGGGLQYSSRICLIGINPTLPHGRAIILFDFDITSALCNTFSTI